MMDSEASVGLFDLHMHTPLCGHAFGHPEAYVRSAAEKGLVRIAFTCHVPFDHPEFGGPGIRMPESRFEEYLELVEQARELGSTLGVEVLTGIEGEVFPDPEIQATIGEMLTRHPFDFVLGSVHHQLPAYNEWFARSLLVTDDQLITAYFEQVRDGAASGLFHSMSHPDVIRLYGTIRGPFSPAAHESVIREAIAAAVENDVCWEVNTSGRGKGDFVEHPDPLVRAWGLEMGLRFTIGSDAHRPDAVGQYFPEVIAELAAQGIDALHTFRKGVRQAVPIADLLAASGPRED